MKKISYIILLNLLILASCNKNDNLIDEGAKEGGLFEVLTNAIIYNLGNMDVNNVIDLKQYNVGDNNSIVRIDIYQQYFTTDDNDSAISTDIKLLKSVDLSSYNTPGYLSTSVSFKELARSTALNGVAIDTIDTDLKSGFYWLLTYKAVLADGREIILPNTQTIFVNAKFAGNYKVLEKKYYRIGVLRDDLDADWEDVVSISAINATTYVLGTHIGPFPGAGKVLFSVEENDTDVFPLTYYKTYTGVDVDELLINSQPAIYCPDDAANLSNVGSCADGSNVLIKGTKDTLVMSFGYLAPTGSREFYYKMVKL